MSSSYELLRDAAMLVASIDESDGDLCPFEASMEDLLQRVDDKTLACLHVLRKLKVEQEDLMVLQRKLMARRKTMERKERALHVKVMQMREAAEELGQDYEVNNKEYSIKRRPSSSVVVKNIALVPEEFRIPQDDKVDKKKAKAAILAAERENKLVPGLKLQTLMNMNWRIK